MRKKQATRLKAAIDARVSSKDQQTEGLSVDDQLRLLRICAALCRTEGSNRWPPACHEGNCGHDGKESSLRVSPYGARSLRDLRDG